MNMTSQTTPTQANPQDLRFDGAHIHQQGSHFESTNVTGGVALQGNFVGVTINSTARPNYAGQFSHSSLEPVKAFVQRPLLRDQIKTQLCDEAFSNNTKTLVVWGLGGAGKTQLVLDYIQQYRSEYKATFWIETGRKESLERDFFNLYQTLFGVQMVAGQGIIDTETAVTGIKRWFSGQQGPWLMVFDGADIIENKESSEYINIKHFIPDAESLHVIVTTRSSTAKNMTRLEGVQVSDMEEAQARELFFRYSQLQLDDQDIEEDINAIIKELGYLALAVTLSSAYVGRTPRLRTNIKAYLPEYRQRRRELLERKPDSLIHQYGESVLTTWETSYHAIQEQSYIASLLMTMMSFFSFDDIFLQLFKTVGEIQSTESTGDSPETSSISTAYIYKLEEYFELLEKYCFVQWKEDQQSYVMHKLVHTWGYDRLTRNDQVKFSNLTFQLVIEAIVGCGSTPEEKLRLVPHVMANFAMLSSSHIESNERAKSILEKLLGVGVFMTDIGRLPEGYMIEKEVVEKSRQILGEEHPDTIWAMNNLANTLGDQGPLEEAAKMKKEVLEKMRQILGEEHPDTISAMNNLANTLGYQGQLEEATKMKKEVLEKMRRILGEEHPHTISAMNNLASTLRDQGQLEEAARMQKEVLGKRRQILGEEHPHTILAMNNLANTLGDQGQLEEAARMQKEVLEKMRQILGEEHPDTISVMNNLANTLGDQGQLEEAARMQKEVLEKRRQILGEEHPDTISAMNNLANTLGDQGQLEEATKMKKEVLEKMRRILGEEHPHTISAMNNLANTLGYQGQLEEAAKMLKEVLGKRRQILGEEHPHTILAMNNLASTLRDQGQLEEAARMQKEVLEKMRQILGEEHPSTILAMNNLANTLGDQGQLEEAARMQKEVLEKRRQILGEEHPDTILAMNNLASTLRDQGQLEEAARMQKEMLEKMRQILGEEHPDTISAMNNLASTLGDQGQLEGAISLLIAAVQKMKRILGDEHPHTKIAINNLSKLTTRNATLKATERDYNSDKIKVSLYARLKRTFRKKAK